MQTYTYVKALKDGTLRCILNGKRYTCKNNDTRWAMHECAHKAWRDQFEAYRDAGLTAPRYVYGSPYVGQGARFTFTR